MKAFLVSAQSQAMLLHEQLHFCIYTTQHVWSWGTQGPGWTQSNLSQQKHLITTGFPSTAASLTCIPVNYFCDLSATPRWPVSSFSSSGCRAGADWLAPVRSGCSQICASSELQTYSKVRQSSPLRATLCKGILYHHEMCG